MEKGGEGGRVEKITHFAHPQHPLVLTEVEAEAEAEAKAEQYCWACLESLFGSIFSCEECNNFHLHKFCADAPLEISHSPYHRKHPSSSLTLHTNRPSDWPYTCDLCKESRKNMFVYRCSSCFFILDIKCALLLHNINIDECNFRELRYLGHQHPLSLTFINNPNPNIPDPNDDNDHELVKRSSSSRSSKSRASCCYWCHKPVVDSAAYVCSDQSESSSSSSSSNNYNCRLFYLHKKCARSPDRVYHPCDRKHPLYIEHGELVCRLCENEHWSFFYRCVACNFDIDIECVQSRPRAVTLEGINNHEHSFNQFLRPSPFICDACGDEGKYNPYTCSICCIMVHKKCISLPRIIRTTRHHHYVIHNYFFQKEENPECGICLGEVDMQYGSYSCLKPDCNYVSHVKCAMEMYDHVNDQDIEDEESSEYLARNSSITCVIERNEHGEATKVKHCCHEHDLTLGNGNRDQIKEADDHEDGKQYNYYCDGCMLSISIFSTEIYYYCSQCDFNLHKACAQLPRKKHHWFYRSLTTLESIEEGFKCDRCNRLCSGFAYKDDFYYKYFCLRCVRISHTPKCQGHEHTLFFDFKFEGECNGCGAPCRDGAFKCRHCSWFALDFACITLPQAARHKCDKHPLNLKLAFHDQGQGNDDDDPEQHRCDVCEEKKNPNYWFYHCTHCDNSAHPKCLFGNFPFIKPKIGAVFPYRYHPHDHPLFFVAKNIYDNDNDMIICYRCEKPFEDITIALQCRHCSNYVIHLDCWSWWNIRDC